MNNLLQLFADNILPIFITAGAGWVLGKVTNIDPSSIARVAFYVFSPALIFNQITTNQIPTNDFLHIVLLAVLVTTAIGIVSWTMGKILKLERKLLAALMLVSMLPNAGNYGLSVSLFSFGDIGLAYASIYFVTMASLTYTVGVMIASMGSKSPREAFIDLIKLPVLYALLAAFLFIQFELTLPIPIERSVSFLSQAAIPTMLILLGLQLKRVSWNHNLRALSVANLIRLVISPIAAIGIVIALGLDGIIQQTGVLEAAMPSAVMTIILATEYDVEPGFVTGVVTSSTLLSPLTLTPLLMMLG